MMKMTFNEVYFWYKIHERQIAEDAVIDDYLKKQKEIPEGKAFERAVEKKIKEWYPDDEE